MNAHRRLHRGFPSTGSSRTIASTIGCRTHGASTSGRSAPHLVNLSCSRPSDPEIVRSLYHSCLPSPCHPLTLSPCHVPDRAILESSAPFTTPVTRLLVQLLQPAPRLQPST